MEEDAEAVVERQPVLDMMNKAFPSKRTIMEVLITILEQRIPARFRPLIDDFKSKYGKNLVELEKKMLQTNWAGYMESKTGIQSSYWTIGSGVLGVIFFRFLFKWAASLVTNLVGFVYPAYKSMKALETKEKDDDTQWLTYWVVFGCFNIVDHFSGFILKWIPFYYVAKIATLVWCFHPTFLGANVIYQRILRPYFKKYESTIDQTLEQGALTAKAAINDVISRGKDGKDGKDGNERR